MVWRQGEEWPLAGRLDLTESALRLQGGNGESREQLVIPYRDILGLERDPHARIGDGRAITIVRRDAGELLIASVGGVSFLSEIFAAVQQVIAG